VAYFEVKYRHVPGGTMEKRQSGLSWSRPRFESCSGIVPNFLPRISLIWNTLTICHAMTCGHKNCNYRWQTPR